MGSRRGRPNKRSVMMLPMLEQLGYRDPAVVLAEIAAMPEMRLRKMTKTEAGRQALAARIRAAAELMPYCHAKMAVKVDIGGDLPVFHILGDRDQLSEENQGVAGQIIDHVGRNDVGSQADLIETIEQLKEKADD
jgi:hypothetical protein